MKSPGDYQVFIGGLGIAPQDENDEVVGGQFSIILTGNCFTHSGDGETVAHLIVDFIGKVQLNEGNCFDLPKETSVEFGSEQNVQLAQGIFDCHTCQVPSIPTSPPTNMPSATPAATPEPTTPPPTRSEPPSDYVYPTQSSVPSSKPTTQTSVPQTSEPIVTSEPTSSTSSGGSSSDSGNSKKNQSKKIVLIAGIAVAAVVIIVVVVILIWLFVCRNRTSIQEEERTRNNEMNDETISGITGVEDTNQTDDPIWAGTSGTQDNLLFDGNENGDGAADEPANNDFEESWGAM